jgi:heterotetrameric sarcosine oxidase gamma subunit
VAETLLCTPRRSALGEATYAVDLHAVTIRERTPLAIVEVVLFDADGTGAEVASALAAASLGHPSAPFAACSVLPLGPARYHIVGAVGAIEPAALRRLIPPNLGAVVTLGDGRCIFRISGPGAAAFLAKGITLDLDASEFPVGRVAGTLCHRIPVVLHRCEANTFDLHVYRGFARSLADLLELDVQDFS